MSNHFPPTPAELIGIVLVLLFWIIDFILALIEDSFFIAFFSVLGLLSTIGVLLVRRLPATT